MSGVERFIVGNLPFIGGKDLSGRLHIGYAEVFWKVHPHIPPPSCRPAKTRLHQLNEYHATELSSLSRQGLERLIGAAFFAATIDDGDGLVIVCDQDTPYDSPNFLWFKSRYPRFVYVDRVAVSPARRGEGLARQLYEAVFAAARAAGHDNIVCEVNYDPPNPASDAFHEKLGFTEVGRAHLTDRGKSVRYLQVTVQPPLPTD